MDPLFTKLYSQSANMLNPHLDHDVHASQRAFWRLLFSDRCLNLPKHLEHISSFISLHRRASADQLTDIINRISDTKCCYLYPRLSLSQLESVQSTSSNLRVDDQTFDCNLSFLNLVKQNVIKFKNNDLFSNPHIHFDFLFPLIDFDFGEAISSLTNQELVELSRTNELFVTTMQDSLAFESLLSDFHLRNRSFYLMLLGKSSLGSMGFNNSNSALSEKI